MRETIQVLLNEKKGHAHGKFEQVILCLALCGSAAPRSQQRAGGRRQPPHARVREGNAQKRAAAAQARRAAAR